MGDDIASIRFEGDDGADVFVTLGSDIGSIQFEGDSSDSGADTFVNRPMQPVPVRNSSILALAGTTPSATMELGGRSSL